MSTPVLQFDPGAEGIQVDLERLIASRVLIQANSGGGKSWLTRYLLEQTHGQVQQLVLDPEGEFATLRERHPYILAGKDGDVPAEPKVAKLLCRRLVESGASAVVDLYDLKLQERRRFVRLFLEELMHLPRSLWRPLLVVLDEAHRFVPEKGSSEASDAVISLCSQGRKRGFAAVLVTQRLSKLDKDAAAELLNVLIGRTQLDVDAKRAADLLGFDAERRRTLRDLRPGQFYAFGPAFPTNEVTLVRSGDVATTHPEPGKIAAEPPPAPEELAEILAELQDLPEQAEEEARTVEDLRRQVGSLERELRSARNAQPAPVVDEEAIRSRIHEELHEEFTGQLHEHLSTAITAGIGLAAERLRATLNGTGRHLAAIGEAVDALAETFDEDLPEALADLEDDPPMPEDLRIGGFAPPPRAPRDSTRQPAQQRRELTQQPTRRIPEKAAVGELELSGPEQRILDALRTLEELGVAPATNEAAAAVAGYRPTSGHYTNVRGGLNSKGLIRYPRPNHIALTDEGRATSRARDDIRSLEGLHQAWLSLLDGPQQRLLSVLLEQYPRSLTNEELAERAGYRHTSGHYTNVRGSLSTLGAVHYPQPGHVAATELLFPEGLR